MNFKSSIVELIYDVPLGESIWDDVVLALQNELHATLVVLFIAHKNQQPIIVSTTRKDDKFWRTYEEHYWKIDPWNEVLISHQHPTNIILPGNIYIPNSQLNQGEYFNDFWKPNGLFYTAGGRLETKNNIAIQLGMPREKSAGPYSEGEIKLINMYAQHIRRAIEFEGFIGKSLPLQAYECSIANKFGLTPSEARLLITLLSTRSLRHAAASLHRSYNTVRVQLKAIFRKTDTSSQADLFARVLKR